MRTSRALLFLSAFLALFLSKSAQATPYASGVTNNNGTIQFYLNEPADTNGLWVVFNDGTTNFFAADQATNTGLHSFTLSAGQTNFQIFVKKSGNGTPTQISSDAGLFSGWPSPRGVAVNRNPQTGYLFGRGIYALNSDLSQTAISAALSPFPNGFWAVNASSPYRMSVAPDNSLYVGDYSATTNQGLYRFGPDFEYTNRVLAASVVGRLSGRPVVTGSPSTGDFTIYTADATFPDNATNSYGWSADDEGPGHAGEYNNIFRYKLGANTIPAGGWTNEPDLSINVGLNGIPTLTLEPAIDPTTGNIYCMFYRGNWADPCLIVTDPTGVNRLFTSMPDALKNIGPDPLQNAYSLDISPDGKFLVVEDVYSAINVVAITNGIPDMSSQFVIPDDPEYANSRGVSFDAADNIYSTSSGQGLLRVFSLGFSTTAVTGNDVTGTNGTFNLSFPAINASVVATAPNASQNHGSPTPGTFTISLNTNFLASPLTVDFVLGGTATNGTFIASETNSVTFPAGTSPSGNWSETVTITPTATPVSGPTLTVTLKVVGAPSYRPVSPTIDTVYIQNTGPQLVAISSVPGPTIYRGLTNDAANIILTRYGDTNAPTFTITNFTYGGTAVFGVDYNAGVQAPTGGNPTAGNPGFTFAPGEISKQAILGNPVPDAQNAVPANKTIVLGLGSGTQTAQEGSTYEVDTNTATITEIDNAVGPEVVLWSDTLNSAITCINYTVTFASTNLGTNQQPPVVIKNYPNTKGYVYGTDGGGTNDFDVEFGYDISADSVGPSLEMQSNGWTTALKVNVNKDFSYAAAAGVNVMPQGVTFGGNYALRFNMALVEDSSTGTYPSQFATFGINNYGTNCDWIGADATSGSGTTNQDGIWAIVGAGEGAAPSGVPADFAMYAASSFPNKGWLETVSAVEEAYSDVFRHPTPFTGTAQGTTNVGSPANLEGMPANTWVDVELKQYQGTNTMSIDKTTILTYSNVPPFSSGTVMLGYDDPFGNVGDPAAAVYYSNVRVVELAPFVSTNPVSVVVPEFASTGFSATAIGTAPFTNVWYFGTTPVFTNVVSTATDSTSYSIPSAAPANEGSYSVVVSDAAGSITSSVATLSVVVGPTVTNSTVSITTNWHVSVTLPAGISGTAPTYEWSLGGTVLTNGGRISGATSGALTISDLQVSDSGTYSVVATNIAGTASNAVILTVIVPPSPDISSITLSGTNTSIVFGSSDIYDTTGSFKLLGSTNVNGPYTAVSTSITNSGTNFYITIPQGGPTEFYQIKHQ